MIKNYQETPSTGNRPVQKVKVGESTRHKWVNVRPGPDFFMFNSAENEIFSAKVGIFLFISKEIFHAQLCLARKTLLVI